MIPEYVKKGDGYHTKLDEFLMRVPKLVYPINDHGNPDLGYGLTRIESEPVVRVEIKITKPELIETKFFSDGRSMICRRKPIDPRFAPKEIE